MFPWRELEEELKKQGEVVARAEVKTITRSLWGGLSEVRRCEKTVRHPDTFILDADVIVQEAKPNLRENGLRLTITRAGESLYADQAALPATVYVVTSLGRLIMEEQLYLHGLERVARVHTDGFHAVARNCDVEHESGRKVAANLKKGALKLQGREGGHLLRTKHYENRVR